MEISESFRDSLATITEEGKRKWIYPKKPSGKFHNARAAVSVFLLLVLFAVPFIKVNGHPFFLLNVIERNFILFGVPFGPHDFHLFVIAMIALVVFIILFTVVFGRVFCGWACPQTVFMEMVFRKIEYWIEGDARKQKQLKAIPWNRNKAVKRISKHAIFFALAFLISNFFLAYIISMDALLKIITDPPGAHIGGLTAILIFSGIFYWVFAYFREQACTIVCPYGRLQGVLLDQDSLVIAYDNVRGEPRGRIKKGEQENGKGDCIDCGLCIDVCPTGIDIRNGIQLECVNCTACIDECNKIMEKIKRPKGLIRYDSLKGIERKEKFRITPRIIFYSAILLVLLSVLGYLLMTRSDYSVNIFRTPGMLYQKLDNDIVSNLYDLNFINKTFNDASVSLILENIRGEIKTIGSNFTVKSQSVLDAKFLVLIPEDEIKVMNTPLVIGLYSGGNLITKISTSFLGPVEEDKDEHEK